MKTKKVKEKKCRSEICENMFTPSFRTTDMFCSKGCEIDYKKQISENRKLLENKDNDSLRRNSLKKPVFEKLLQLVFNTWVKLRDKDSPCITCGKTTGVMEAGHCYKVSSYPNLRFHESNVHKQCYECNRDKDGWFEKYIIELPKRVGEQEFLSLLEYKNVPLKMSIPEIQEQIKIYRDKIKELKK